MTCNAAEVKGLSYRSAARLVEWLPIFREYAQRYNLPLALLLAVAHVESRFTQSAVSSANARGVMQLLPTTFEWLKVGGNIWDVRQNIHAGAKYLHLVLKRFSGDFNKAIAAYNCGGGRVKKKGITGQCKAYLDAVLKWWARMEPLAACPTKIYAEGGTPIPPSRPPRPRPTPRPSMPPPRNTTGANTGAGLGAGALLLFGLWLAGGGSKWLD